MDRDTIQEIAKVWDKIGEMERKLSNFTEERHKEAKEGITGNSEGLFDVADAVGENSDGIFDIAEVVAALEDRVATLEEG